MERIRRYLRINEEYKLFQSGGHVVEQADSTDWSDSTEDIVVCASGHNYQLHSSYLADKKPKVMLFGITHCNGIDQESDLEKILLQVLSPNDILAIEGDGPYEISYDYCSRGDIIGRLKPFLRGNNIRTMLNDGKRHAIEFVIAARKISEIREKYQDRFDSTGNQDLDFLASIPGLIPDIKKYMDKFDARDLNFCHHEATGLIPLIDGTTENYGKMAPNAKIAQLVGLLHVYNRVIQSNLREAEIPYLVFVPTTTEK
jgi:hypothetical protein